MGGSKVTAHDVGAYILEQMGRMDTMKFQKLLYYCNGWNLAFRGQPLFTDRTEAWRFGPVVRSVYSGHREKNSVSEWTFGDAGKLTDDNKALVSAVLEMYGAMSGWALANQTHEEHPWMKARGGLPDNANCENEVLLADIEEYFRGLLEAQ